jgi:hypothetical protein
VRDAEQVEERRGDGTGQDVLRRILAPVTPPRHDEQRGKPVHQRQRRERVQARAEPGVLHEHARPPAREPGAGGEADGGVLAHGGDVRGPSPLLEHGDDVLDERARHAGEEVEAVTFEQRRDVVTGDHALRTSAGGSGP